VKTQFSACFDLKDDDGTAIGMILSQRLSAKRFDGFA
jgi:hypothetical protein